MKKNKLYTVNRWNQPAFMVDRYNHNIFDGLTPGQSSQMLKWDRLASNEYGANYGDSGFTMNDYMNSKNWLGISKKNNPFSKGNIGNLGSSLGNIGLGIAGSIGNRALKGLIGGDLESGAGNAIADIGNSVGGLVSNIPGIGTLGGMAIQLGTGAIGGLVNRAFGSKLNEENIANVKNKSGEITKQGSLSAGAQSNEDVIGNWGNADLAFNFDKDYIGKDGWFSSKAADKFDEMQRLLGTAKRSAVHGLEMGVHNADTNQDNDVASNFIFAYGGPMDFGGGALGLMQQNRYFDTIDKRSEAIAGKGQTMQTGFTGAKTFADGGNLFAGGGTFRGKKMPYITHYNSYRNNSVDAMRKAGFTDEEIDDWNIHVNHTPGYKKLSDGEIVVEPAEGTFGGGTFAGSGSTSRWTPAYRPNNNSSFNEAYDEARSAGAETFMFGDKEYNTLKEANPIREFNNRYVGAGRTEKTVKQRKGYGKDFGPIGGTLAGLPFITFADGGLKSAFLDEFGKDPIAAAVRYNQGLEAMAAQKEAEEAEAAREAEYADMQKRLLSLETQNQGLQALMAAQSVPATTETVEETTESSSSPSAADYNSNWDYIEDQLKRSGKFNDVQIQGIKYNLQRESGIGQFDGGDNGTARGLAQWRGNRIPKDLSLEGQTKYLIDTLSNYDGKLHWIGEDNYRGFMNARTPEEAHYYIARGYERPHSSIIEKVKRDSDMSLKNLSAFGGELGTNGTDFTNGLLYIDEGGSHEENPLEGVPMGLDPQGIPNLVEEGETIYNDYVFSDRMKVPFFMYKELGLGGVMKKKGKEMSFADASKKLAQESEQRPNDPISQDGLEASLARLAEVQEAERMRKQGKEYMGLEEYACGGKMGNKYDLGGITEYLNSNYSGGNKKAIAAAMDAYIKKQTKLDKDFAKARNNIQYGKALDFILRNGALSNPTASRSTKGSNEGRAHYNALLQLGLPRKVAFGIAFPDAKGYSDRSGYHSIEKERAALYNELVLGNGSNQAPAAQPQSNADRLSAKASAMMNARRAVEVKKAQQQVAMSNDTTTTASTTTSTGNRGKATPGGSSYKPWDGMHADTPSAEGVYTGYPSEATQKPATTPIGAETQAVGYVGANAGLTNDEVREMGLQQAGNQAAQRIAETRGLGLENPELYDTWMRYAPAVGSGIMAMTDALGLTNKADYSMADKIEAYANRAGVAPNISYNPIGDYLTYRPMDIWYEQNALNAQSRATDRALMNSSSPSRAAGLLANGYNSQLASGNLYRQALEYNDTQREKVADFNRRTNMFNSQMGLEADMANARYQQAARQMGLSGLAQAAALRDSIDARVGASRSANLTNFLTSLGNIGRENFAMNQINDDAAYNYGIRANGTTPFKRSGACGGKIKRRK